MAPVISLLDKQSWCVNKVVATAQHREMLDDLVNFFKIKIDYDLNLMKKNQSLSTLTSKILLKMSKIIDVEKPDLVIVQGDTTSVLSIALSCFYHKVKVAHIEAGLRTFDIYNPYPEEGNRVLVSKLAHFNFAPTNDSFKNLIKEGVNKDKIFITGNTVIDSLVSTTKKYKKFPDKLKFLKKDKYILITFHRRENLGEPLINLCESLVSLSNTHPNFDFVISVHPNPNVKNIIIQKLSNISNIYLSPPLIYKDFILLMKNSYFILSDSGGIQEEAPTLGKPVLVLRETTERPEAVNSGLAVLIGTKKKNIIKNVNKLILNKDIYLSMIKKVSPFGDGKASNKIIQYIKKYL